MDPIEVEIQLNKEDITKGYSIMKAERPSKTFYWSFQIGFAILGILGFIMMPLVQSSTYNAAFLSFFGTMVAYSILSSWVSAHFLDKLWKENDVWHSPYTVSVSTAGYKTKSIHGAGEDSWQAFKKILETNDYFLLVFRSGTFLSMPKRCFDKKVRDDIRQVFKDAMKDRFVTNPEQVSDQSVSISAIYWIVGALIAVIAIIIYGGYYTSTENKLFNNPPVYAPDNFDVREHNTNSGGADFESNIQDRLAPLEAELKKYQADIFSKCETDDIMSNCTYLLASRDTMSSSSLIRGAAQATIQAYYKEFAEGLDDKQLIWKLKDEQSRAAFYSQYSNSSSEARDIDRIDSALAGNAYLAEFEKRGLKDPSIDTDAFFGPCWGIPEGWCLE